MSVLLIAVFLLLLSLPSACEAATKTQSVLHSTSRRIAAIKNAERFAWAKSARDSIVEQAEPWKQMSYDETWNLMFSSNISRSWMVWSDGFCPECHQDVRMYTWIIDIWGHPFKVQCPHCKSLFPTNDFEAFYRSGLNRSGEFDPALADRSLLFNQNHPDPQDPKHLFGVDDGEGYLQEAKRWRFIGYYLSAGQWRQKIVGGVASLAEAYSITGDMEYSRRAGILLDRIADLHPSFDFATQGEVYEKRGSNGYVSVWHDACAEIQRLIYAYDQIFDGIKDDLELISFLSRKATQTACPNAKSSFAEIQENIESRIFLDSIAQKHKINSNYPMTPVAIMTINAVLGWPVTREAVLESLCEIARTSTVKDGLTGERGLSGYSAIFPFLFSDIIARFDALDSTLIDELFRRHPALGKTWRFFIDTWCLEKFYPCVGDCGRFGAIFPNFVGVSLNVPVRFTSPSGFSFMWRLYEITGDPDYVKVIYKANDYKTADLPHDLGEKDPDAFQQKVQKVIDQTGQNLTTGDSLFPQWGISVSRSGQGDFQNALWIMNNSSGNHGHLNALNIGLYARGTDLLPDFGYPPVGYGGWNAPKATWYLETAAHNTVVADAVAQQRADGAFALWCPGKELDLVKASAAPSAGCEIYQRTLLKVDISDEDFYVVDLFQIVGGSEHAYFLSSGLGKAQATGLSLEEEVPAPFPNLTRNFRGQSSPAQGWTLDWCLRDESESRSKDAPPLHLSYIGLTENASVSLGECWIDTSNSFGGREEWLPRLMVRRRSETPGLRSDFLGILQPYDREPFIISAIRQGLTYDPHREALVVDLVDGRRQIFLFSPVSGSPIEPKLVLPRVRTDAEFVFLSFHRDRLEQAGLYNGTRLEIGRALVSLTADADVVPYAELCRAGGKLKVISKNDIAVKIKP